MEEFQVLWVLEYITWMCYVLVALGFPDEILEAMK